MQTFLPYPNFVESASILDPLRLGNQFYRECKTILNGGWSNHPASKMWKDFEWLLCQYALACGRELANRRKYYPNHIHFFIEKAFENEHTKYNIPKWLGFEPFHISHQSNLIRKNPDHYRKFFPDVPDDIPYYWPSKETAHLEWDESVILEANND